MECQSWTSDSEEILSTGKKIMTETCNMGTVESGCSVCSLFSTRNFDIKNSHSCFLFSGTKDKTQHSQIFGYC